MSSKVQKITAFTPDKGKKQLKRHTKSANKRRSFKKNVGQG